MMIAAAVALILLLVLLTFARLRARGSEAHLSAELDRLFLEFDRVERWRANALEEPMSRDSTDVLASLYRIRRRALDIAQKSTKHRMSASCLTEATDLALHEHNQALAARMEAP